MEMKNDTESGKPFGGFFKGKKVLITGHTGFKGSWLSLYLHMLEADVYGYALEPVTSPSLYNVAGIDLLVESEFGDVRDLPRLRGFINEVNPDIVIHMAAQSLVRESYKSPVDTYSTNVMGTVNLFEACRGVSSVRVILNVTTDKCYENMEWHWGYREDDQLGGYDPYSNSKACSELVTSAYRNSFYNSPNTTGHIVKIATARAGNVIGGGDWAADRLIPDFIRAISENRSVEIRSPLAIRPWQHVLEPLTGYLTLVVSLFSEDSDFSGSWNFGPYDNDVKSVEWITESICRMWGEGANYKIDKDPQPYEAKYLKLDCSKARNELGWCSRCDIAQSLKMIVDWNKAYLNGDNMRNYTERQIEDYLNLLEK